jgi:hypothetical protein
LFKWAADDDIYQRDYLERCVRMLDENPDSVLAHTGTAFIDEASELLPYEERTGSFIDRKTGKRYWADVATIGDSPVPISRFRQVLTRARWGTHMFGVIRREVLRQTSLLPNFAGSDRVMLSELALLGRFRCTSERLFLKRFHSNASATLNDEGLKRFLSTDGKRYSRRLRQIQAFLNAPRRKPIGVVNKTGCFLLVAAHSAKVALQHLSQGDPRRARHGYGWSGTVASASRRRSRG